MPARSSTPGAIRNRRYRRRLREGLIVVPIEVPVGDIEGLIDGEWLGEDEAGDLCRLGEEILKAARASGRCARKPLR